MKRLTVRLSIVGAVLAMGGSAITYSVLSKPSETPAQEDAQQATAVEKAALASLKPIRSEGDPSTEPSQSLQPPPPSAFAQSTSLRTVSHESIPEAIEDDDAKPLAKSADMIPTADPGETNSVDGTGIQQPPSTNYGGTAAFPTEPAGPSTRGAPERPSSFPPASPAYAASFPTSDPSGSPAAHLSDAAPASTSSAVAASASGSEFGTGSAQSVSGSAPNGLSTSDAPRETGRTNNTASLASNSSGSGSLGAPVAVDNEPEAPLIESGTSYTTSPEPYANGSGLRSGPSPAAGLSAGAAIGATAAGATVSELGKPAESLTATSPNYPSTDAAGRSKPGTSVYAQPSSDPYGIPTANEGAGAAPLATTSGVTTDRSTTLLASDLPGDRQLEGQQSPAILIEKLAPEEIQVDRKATFQLRVRNAGNAPAHNVLVVDRVPRGTEFIDAVPPVSPTADGTLVWQLETIKPNEEMVLSVNLMPKTAGEIGSVAQATFQTQASVRTICTQPVLELSVVIPEEVLIGQSASLEITVTNTGNGAAEGVVIEEDVPEGFAHAAGRELEHEIGTLRPQESRRLTLVLESAAPGSFENHLTVRGEGNLLDEDIRQINVTSPQLQIDMQGPSLRYLDRQATYAVRLSNPGTASARNVELVTYLPKGMKYVTSDNQGQYDSQSHAVFWSLEELPATKQGDVHFTVLPIEPGNHKLKTDGRADLGLQHACEHEVVVEGLAEIAFAVSDVADPIEVGSDTAYEIRVQNHGSKADTDIQLVAEMPEGITPTSGDGPTQGTVQGQRVTFASLARLGPGEEAIFKVHARGAATGNHVIRVQVQSTELRVPVTKEEITRVYSDQ